MHLMDLFSPLKEEHKSSGFGPFLRATLDLDQPKRYRESIGWKAEKTEITTAQCLTTLGGKVTQTACS